MQDYLGDNIIFIVGCPRSGTTWLRNLLGSDPSIHTGPESFLFARYIGSPLRSWQKDARGTRKIAMAEYMSDQEFLFALRQFMGNLLSPMIKDLGTDEIFVEKTPEHAFYMKEIYELLPKCKFIHILRDGRDVVSSLLAYSKTERGGTWAPHSARKAARMWTGYVRTVRTNSRDIPPDQFLEIRYENLFSATLDSLKTIFQFMGVEWHEEAMINAISKTKEDIPKLQKIGFVKKATPGGWKELSFPRKVLAWHEMHGLMNELGYVWKYPW